MAEMCGFDTTMKGRFRSAWIRCARRTGSSESVKFADESNASTDNGGWPCLGFSSSSQAIKKTANKKTAETNVQLEMGKAYLSHDHDEKKAYVK